MRGEWKKSKKKCEDGEKKHVREKKSLKETQRERWQNSYKESEGVKIGEGCQQTSYNYEIEMLGEIKLKICDERQREKREEGRMRGVTATYHHTAEGDID